MRGWIDPVLRNSITKPVYRALGLTRLWVEQRHSAHYRMQPLEDNGGVLVLNRYQGPPIEPGEWEGLDYVTYDTDPRTFFAPLASADGEPVMEGFWRHGKPDKDGVWTPHAQVAKRIQAWVTSIGARFGRVQIIRKEPNSRREAVWNLHLDDNNRLNPEAEGWVVRLWLELTDSPDSRMILREDEFDGANEFQVPLPRYTQILMDSQYLFHSVHHAHSHVRYGVIVSLESGPALEEWIERQMPQAVATPGWAGRYKQRLGLDRT